MQLECCETQNCSTKPHTHTEWKNPSSETNNFMKQSGSFATKYFITNKLHAKSKTIK